MKKITTTSSFLYKLNNAEHDYLHRVCNRTLEANAGGITLLAPAITLYHELYLQEDYLFKLSQKMSETKSLERLDRMRDEEFLNFKTLVELSLRSKTDSVRQAAERVMFILDRYKNAHLKPYSENTDLLINMFQDLQIAPYPDLIETLQATDILALLEEKNNAFDILYLERAQHQYEINEEGKLLQIRKQVDAQFLMLADQINALYMTTKMVGTDTELIAKLEMIIMKISAYIAQAERVYYHRVNRSKPGRKPDPVDPTPPIVEPYRFVAASQTIDKYAEMRIVDSDPETFAILFDGELENSILRMYPNDMSEWKDFPFKEYARDADDNAVGIIVGPPDGFSGFEMNGATPIYKAYIDRDDARIIEVSNIKYPQLVI